MKDIGIIMLAKFEERKFADINVWTGKYKKLTNTAHWHKETEIIYIEEGYADIGINKEIYKACKNDIFLVKSGDIHYLSGSKDSIISILIFDTEIAKRIIGNHFLELSKLTREFNFPSLSKDISSELKSKKLFYKEKICALINSFLADVFSSEKLSNKNFDTSTILSYQEIIEYIDTNFANVTFSDAAKNAGYSESHYSKLFKRLTGSSFTDYLNQIRIEKAVDMILYEKDKLTNIAFACGFNSIRHFNRVFKKETGFIPKEIRNNKNFNLFNINPKKVSEKTFNPTLDNSQLLE